MYDTKCIFSAHIMCMVHTPFNGTVIIILRPLVAVVVFDADNQEHVIFSVRDQSRLCDSITET